VAVGRGALVSASVGKSQLEEAWALNADPNCVAASIDNPRPAVVGVFTIAGTDYIA